MLHLSCPSPIASLASPQGLQHCHTVPNLSCSAWPLHAFKTSKTDVPLELWSLAISTRYNIGSLWNTTSMCWPWENTFQKTSNQWDWSLLGHSHCCGFSHSFDFSALGPLLTTADSSVPANHIPQILHRNGLVELVLCSGTLQARSPFSSWLSMFLSSRIPQNSLLISQHSLIFFYFKERNWSFFGDGILTVCFEDSDL